MYPQRVIHHTALLVAPAQRRAHNAVKVAARLVYKRFAVGAGLDYQGVQVHIMDYEKVALSDIQFYVMEALAELYPDKAVFKGGFESRYRMFDQVAGSDQIRLKFAQRHKFEDIKEYWYKDVEAFKTLSKRYYLYK